MSAYPSASYAGHGVSGVSHKYPYRDNDINRYLRSRRQLL